MNLRALETDRSSSIIGFPQPKQQSLFNRIICGDAADVMGMMAPGSVDLVVAAPPYIIRNSTGNGLKNGRGGKWQNAALQHGYTHHDDRMPHDSYVAWQRQCLSAMMRVLSDDGAIFYNHKWRGQGGLLQDRQGIGAGFPGRAGLGWGSQG